MCISLLLAPIHTHCPFQHRETTSASTMTVAHTGNWPNWGERRKRNIFLSKASGDVHDKFATAKSSAARDA